jgi:prepilin-type N-terminal cleavage/methylation domain-containing protein/prepilin-type processing-associated H-X9-DG protein
MNLLRHPQDERRGSGRRLWRRAGFTLVELLVVTGIIAVLTGILLPAGMKAMQHSRAVVCQSNLRQLAVTALMYTENNRGYFPPAHYIDTAGTPANALTGAPVLLKSYLPDMRIFECPTDPQAINVHKVYGSLYRVNPDLPEFAGYSYNFFVFINALASGARATRRDTLRRPSDLILLFDSAVGTGRGGPWELIQARHPGPRFNAVFLDGHAESTSATRAGTTRGAEGDVPNYVVDVSRRPIYYAGAEEIPYRAGGESQGRPIPGYGPIVWGQPDWR